MNQIWVDADACPRVIKEILFRAADRVGIALILVANQALQVPGSRFIRAVQVASGFDVADNYIVQHAVAGELVVTADIPLVSCHASYDAFSKARSGQLPGARAVGLAVLIQASTTPQMAAYRLARRESCRRTNTALQSLARTCHSLRTAPCLGASAGL